MYQTINSLRSRFNGHRSAIKHNKNGTPLVKHFNLEGHSFQDISVRILEVVSANIDRSKLSAYLQDSEDFWSRLFCSAFPYGLNDRIKKFGDASKIVDPTQYKNAPYFCQKMERKTRGKGRKRRSNHKVNVNFLNSFSELTKGLKDAKGVRTLYMYLKSQSASTLKNCWAQIDRPASGFDSFARLIFAGFMSGYFVNKQICNSDRKSSFRIKTNFINKGFEFIGFQNIFADRRLNKLIEGRKESNFKKPAVLYLYDPPISRKICNYSRFLKEINKPNFNFGTISCKCDKVNFGYADTSHHVITGNLNIIKHSGLKKIFAKGSKFRCPKFIDWELVEAECIRVMSTYLTWLANNKLISTGNMDEYSQRFKHILKSRIHHNSLSAEVFNWNLLANSYNNPMVYNQLKELQNKYVIVPADKANNNYVFVCKFWYLKVMCAELGVDTTLGSYVARGNNTYKCIGKSNEVDKILEFHKSTSLRFDVQLDKVNMVIPKIFAIAKLHKNPYKFRFISGARLSSCKPLSLMLLHILKHLKKHFVNYCSTIERNTGVNRYWVVDDHIEVLNKLKTLVQSGVQFTDIVTCDFSTLYTNLPHNCIIECMFQLVELCFKNAGKEYIAVSKMGKTWYCASNDVSSGVCLHKQDVKDLISVVLSEAYVQFGGFVFKQVLGIPMGGAASPLIANLTLGMLEYEYLKTNYQGPNRPDFYVMRYIDDNLVLNCANFMAFAKNIYPAELPLSKTNTHDKKAAYLDLEINIEDNLKIAVYNKTDDFNFEVVKYVCADSEMHSHVGLGVFYSQLIRFGRICSKKDDFEKRVLDMLHSFMQNGFNRNQLMVKFCEFCTKSRSLLLKYGVVTKGDCMTVMSRIFL